MRAYLYPFTSDRLKNKIFDPSSSLEVTSPIMLYLKKYFEERGIELNTADFWDPGKPLPDDTLMVFDHPPVGAYRLAYALRNFLIHRQGYAEKDRYLRAFLPRFPKRFLFQWEPPVNAPWAYSHLYDVAKQYHAVYFCPTVPKFPHFYYPQVSYGIREEYFNRKSRKFLTMINSGGRRAKGYLRAELYGKRVDAARYFGSRREIEIYGEFWDRERGFPPDIWKGPIALGVDAKFNVMSQYQFAICYENSAWPGYVSEKIFDCLFCGTVPIYWGAPDIENDVPEECFIDGRKFLVGGRMNYDALRAFLRELTPEETERYRAASKIYLASSAFHKFTKEGFAEMLFGVVTGRK